MFISLTWNLNIISFWHWIQTWYMVLYFRLVRYIFWSKEITIKLYPFIYILKKVVLQFCFNFVVKKSKIKKNKD